MKAFSIASLVAMLLAWPSTSRAEIIIDQQNTAGSSVMNSNYGQSFTAGTTSINAASFDLATTTGTLTMHVNLYEGGGNGGTLLGSSMSVALPVTNGSFATLSMVEFDFASTISLTQGDVYSLFLVKDFGTGRLDEGVSSSDTYAGGQLYSGTTGYSSYDVIFAEGVVPASVPEPSSLAMCGLAGLIGSAYAWRSRKRAAIA